MNEAPALQFDTHEPSGGMRRYVRYFWTLRGVVAPEDMHPILPDGSPELIFNLGARVLEIDNRARDAQWQPEAMMVGQMVRPVTIQPVDALDLIGVRLTPWGAAAFVAVPGSLLANRTWSLAELGENGWAACVPQLRDARDAGSWQPLLERLLRKRVATQAGTRQCRLDRFADALSSVFEPGALDGAPGAPGALTIPEIRTPVRIDDWSHALGCSGRTLERRFHRFVGIGPKELQRLRRFQQALRLGTEQPNMQWSMVAHRTGFADQSHLVREFRQFAGVAPMALRAEMTEVTEIFVEGS